MKRGDGTERKRGERDRESGKEEMKERERRGREEREREKEERKERGREEAERESGRKRGEREAGRKREAGRRIISARPFHTIYRFPFLCVSSCRRIPIRLHTDARPHTQLHAQIVLAF